MDHVDVTRFVEDVVLFAGDVEREGVVLCFGPVSVMRLEDWGREGLTGPIYRARACSLQRSSRARGMGSGV